MTDPEIQRDRVLGAIFGQAVGDALGHPIEFEKTHKVVGLEQDNKFTDDTQMFCAIGEALLDAPPHVCVGNRAGDEAFMSAVKTRFIEWRKSPLGGSHRAPGGTCMEGVRKLGTGKDWRESGATATGKGNGTAMRSGVVGAMYWSEPEFAFRVGGLTSVPTHNNLEAILGAGTVSFLVAASIAGIEFPAAVAGALELCADCTNAFLVPVFPKLPLDNTREGQNPWKTAAKFGSAFAQGIGTRALSDFLKDNGDDFTVVPAVSEAIFYNARYSNYLDAVMASANNSDDSDTITAITGTIAGARFGFSSIPEDWRNRIELSSYLLDLSERIWNASSNLTYTSVEVEF
jgi:ADP-ribosylglycohydrolase